ncbi:aspartate carbamoyltransferase regulatory subunit [Candidatus Fermentibacteria bacterium]|nr:aspartate carbamoyltransferase regulatory subunit [Candidatus Fermentibacteria bacterium]
MSDTDRVLLIPKIDNGIVIDHIPPGFGIAILEIIRRDPAMRDVVVTLGLNYHSSKMGKKDLIKLWLDELSPRVVQHISLVCPGITIKKITNYEVERRYVIRPPQSARNLLRCLNPSCVTNTEPNVDTNFTMVDEEKKKLKCMYCERVFSLKDLKPIIP